MKFNKNSYGKSLLDKIMTTIKPKFTSLNNELQVMKDSSIFTGNGYLTYKHKKDRFMESDGGSELIDKTGESIKIGDNFMTMDTYVILGNEVMNKSYIYTFKTDGVYKIKVTGTGNINGNWSRLELADYGGYSVLPETDGIMYLKVKDGKIYNEKNVMIINNNTITFNFWSGNVGKLYITKLKSITPLLAPFGKDGTDEILDDSLHGPITQQPHVKGDMILYGNPKERVLNNDYTDNTNHWSLVTPDNGEITIDNGILTLTTNSNGGTNVYQEVSVEANIDYIIETNFIEGSGLRVRESNIDLWIINSGRFLHKRNSSTNTIQIELRQYNSDSTAKMGKISIKPMESFYICIEDCEAGTSIGDNTKFKKIDYGTRQDIIIATIDGYEVKKGYHYFEEKEMYADKIAETYGWSKLDNGLYRDEEKDFVIIGIIPTLNNLLYHPIYNTFGTKDAADYNSDNLLNGRTMWYDIEHVLDNSNGIIRSKSLFDCSRYDQDQNNCCGYQYDLGYTTESTSGTLQVGSLYRPDKRVYNKLYYKGLGGLIFIPTYAINVSGTDLLSNGKNELLTNSSDLNIESCLEVYTKWLKYYRSSNTRFCLYAEYGNVNLKLTIEELAYLSKLDSFEIIIRGQVYTLTPDVRANTYCYFIVDRTLFNELNNAIVFEYFTIPALSRFRKSKYLVTQGKTLQHEIIGKYENYNPEWKNWIEQLYPIAVGMSVIDNNDKIINAPHVSGYNKSFIRKATEGSYGMIAVLYKIDNTYREDTHSETYPYIKNNLYISSSVGTDYVCGIVPYIAENKPLVKDDIYPVEIVDTEVIASNSHSWRESAGVINCITNKISIDNNGINNLSRRLNNVLIGSKHYASDITSTNDNVKILVKKGDTLTLDTDKSKSISTISSNTNVFERIYYDYDINPNTEGLTTLTRWIPSVNLQPNIIHDDILLDTSSIIDYGKFFVMLGLDPKNNEYLLQVVGKQIKLDVDGSLAINPGIYVNDVKITPTKRSYTVMYLKQDGSIIDYRSFDVYGHIEEATAMTDYINDIPIGSVVVVETYDEPQNNMFDNDNLKDALVSVGADRTILDNMGYRDTYALIGKKTDKAIGEKIKEDYRPRYSYPVRIEYDITDEVRIRVESRGKDSKSWLPHPISHGDDNRFKHLTNYIYTDTNLRIVNSYVGIKRLGVFKEKEI